ncbi:hypothetical protein AMS68_005390 [Peltaster fructicola]|uniref:Enoyl reductase (ER) domain-containing protein n=1 Tax=Peltaster fructicola TaxID=286661 RepID=A0A6H0XYN7_9PEZI|nr:hypothetical protein AMS68_005390 [Peltaster fructicola]
MYSAQITQWGQPPIYTSVPEPTLAEGQIKVKVIATGIHNVVRARAAGKHYSASTLPHTPGIDGIGTTESGQRVYFTSFTPTGGSLSEYVNVSQVTPLPEGLDSVQAAALVNPALSSWMSMQARASLPPNFTVLIIGATSASGKLAVSLARALGAKKVIGAARSAVESVDESIVLSDHTDFSAIEVDIVLDYVYGRVTEQLFKTLKTPRPVQYVQIGQLSGSSISLPADLLRSKDITIRGSGPGAWSLTDVGKTMPTLLRALASIPPQPVRTARLEDVSSEWIKESKERLVFVMDSVNKTTT